MDDIYVKNGNLLYWYLAAQTKCRCPGDPRSMLYETYQITCGAHGKRNHMRKYLCRQTLELTLLCLPCTREIYISLGIHYGNIFVMIYSFILTMRMWTFCSVIPHN